ncbi:MAG: MFS transporter [Prevotellaceae bacterium]|jgi:OPA family glycerol-3-phosphate transporter-like MFS transporter/OPA family sugar phosphate sensor protein UhpC-like MFS transporter|nr:MFS transporter [Prevotellaceae bacterium]
MKTSSDSDAKKLLKYWQWRTLIATMIGYALFYFVRKNFSFAMPGMEADLGFSKSQLGLFLTLNGVIYGLSRFINGFFADRLNARYYMSIGLMLCAISNFAFGFGTDISTWITGETSGTQFTNILILFMGITLLINGFCQGSGFPPVARLLPQWFKPSELSTKMSIWNTSHSIGAGVVGILCGYIMIHFGTGENHAGAWRWCFWIPSAIAFAGAIGLLFTLRDNPASVGLPEPDGTTMSDKTASKEEKSAEYKLFLRKMVFGNPLMWILAIANFFVYIVRFSVLDWGPTILQQSKGISSTNSGWLVAAFEITGIVGMLAAGWITDKYLNGRTHRTCVFCMIGTALSFAIFWLIPFNNEINSVFAGISFCLIGFFIYGPQALIGIAAANQATKKASAAANGFTGLIGYAATIVSGFGFGYIATNFGWNIVYISVIAVAIAGMAIFLLMWKANADGYERAKTIIEN